MAYQYQSYVPSASVGTYKKRQDDATNNFNIYTQTGYSQGAGGLGSQVNSAQAKLNALYRGNNLSQQFKYNNQGQYNKALRDITDRKPFEYDLSNDMLFQQAKDQYQAMGKTAMADTIGQASAMTGGYGNSYATTAGNQAYQANLQELNKSIGDYYAMALSAYNNETDRLNGVFNAMATDRSAAANEWSNNWSVYNNLYKLYQDEYSDMLGKDMTAWQQKGTNLYNAANLATSQYGTASSNDIDIWNKQEGLKATQAQQLETERANRASEAYKNASLAETKRHNQVSEGIDRGKILASSSKYSSNGNSSGGDIGLPSNKKYSKENMVEYIDKQIGSKLHSNGYLAQNVRNESATSKSVAKNIIEQYYSQGLITESTAKSLLAQYKI